MADQRIFFMMRETEHCDFIVPSSYTQGSLLLVLTDNDYVLDVSLP